MPLKAPPHGPRFLICWIFTIILEAPFILSFFSIPYRLPFVMDHTVIAAHLMAATLLFFSVPKGKGWFHLQRQWAILFFFFTLFLPFIGAVLSLILYFTFQQKENLYDLFADDASLLEMSVETILEMPTHSDSRQEKTRQALDAIPLGDILVGEDELLKRGAIERLAHESTPDAILILLEHSDDPSPEIRFYITSALTRIKKSIEESLEAAKQEMKQNVYDITARILLAKVYIRYARSHLLDDASALICLREAIYHLEYVITTDASHKEAYLMLLNIHEKLQDWDNVFDTVIKMEEKNVIGMNEIIKLKLNYYYRKRNFKMFRKQLQNLIKLKGIEKEWLAMANWWGVSE